MGVYQFSGKTGKKLAVPPSTRSGRTGLGAESRAELPFMLSLRKKPYAFHS
jgi:hypothetical protein